MRNLFMMVLCVFFLNMKSIAQDCTVYFPMEEGVSFELTNYDKKGKVSSTVRHEILENSQTSNGMELSVTSVTTDKKGNEAVAVDYVVKCDNGEFFIDMKNFVPSTSQQSFNSMGLDATVEGDYLVFPQDMQVGKSLPGGSLRISASIMNMTVNIANRKVEAEETITVPAGTYDCIKISYTAEVKMAISVATKIVEWYSKDVGIVQSETYNRSGKLMGTSKLTSFSR